MLAQGVTWLDDWFAIEEVALTGDDLTIIGLFMKADVVVKAVMILLVLASVWSWAVMIEKGYIRRLLERLNEIKSE